MDSNFHATEKEEKLTSFCYFKVPDDAILDETIKRYDNDTPVGSLLEIHVLRAKEVDKASLKGKRYRHMNINIETANKLDHNPMQDAQKM